MSTTKIERLQEARTALANKDFRVLFYAPDTEGVPSGAIIEIYQLAATLRRQGVDALILTEVKTYQVPKYLDEDLQALPHIAVGSKHLAMKPEDIVVIPEYFTSIMAQTAKLPCLRVVLVQGYDNALTTMIPGMSWAQMGISHVWTMSTPMTDFVKEVYGPLFQIQTLRIGVPAYFQPAKVKDPVIAVQVRNALDLKKISNEFYARFPELRWVGFEPLTGRSRRDYAALMSKATVALWIDRVAAFGQTAIEAMACNTPLVALVPDYNPEYLATENAIWVSRMSDVAQTLGRAFKLALESNLPEDLAPAMAATAASYSPAAAEAAAVAAFEATVALRDTELLNLIQYFETKETAATEVAE